jgi:hypothetical protein
MCNESPSRPPREPGAAASPRAIAVALWHSFCFSLLRKNSDFPRYFQQYSFRDYRRNAWLHHPLMCSKT